MPMWAPKAVEKLARIGEVVGDQGGGDLVHAHAAVFLGDVDGGEASSPAFRSTPA